MAYDPFDKYNVSDPYGITPSQRLARNLAGTSYKTKGLKRDYNVDKFDMGKAYKKQVPKLLTN